MSKKSKIVLVMLFAVLPITVVVAIGTIRGLQSDSSNSGSYTELDWRKLRELDYRTGEKPPALARLDGQPVKIPGFVVPLDDEDQGLAEFLLVPSPQACIHVPPPPPNQMVMVKMKGGSPKRSWGPVWVMGRLHIASTDSEFGRVSYTLHGEFAERYTLPSGG